MPTKQTERKFVISKATYDPTTGNLASKAGVNYGYNDAAHAHAVTHLGGVQKYGYDANGNQTKRICQQVIAGYIVDFYCHAASLAVEVDGEVHSTQAEYDNERDRALSEHGIRVLRFGNQSILDELEGVLNTILKVCQERV